ncbi:MAG: NifB/NifX family molybdenum-iron cluster-binding protein [Prolixibacteraceae bacterium]
MKIGFPLKNASAKSMFDDFHACKYIGVYDDVNKTFVDIEVEELYQKSENYNLFSVLDELGIKMVICNRMKPMALRFFNEQKITVYKAEGDQVDLNLELLFDGQLKRFQAQMAEASSCGSSCSSCSSDACSTP